MKYVLKGLNTFVRMAVDESKAEDDRLVAVSLTRCWYSNRTPKHWHLFSNSCNIERLVRATVLRHCFVLKESWSLAILIC